MTPLVRYEVRGHGAWITLNRPEKRNALDQEVVSGLRSGLEQAGADARVRAVVITGAGRAFSAGADLAALEALQHQSSRENVADSNQFAALFRELAYHPKPIIASVNGHAIAGGCGLVAAADFALVSSEARLGFTEVRIGFVPAIVMVFLQRKLRERDVRDLLLRGGLVDAGRALEIGLVTKIVAPDRLAHETEALVEELASETSAEAVALTREMLWRLPAMGLSDALDYASAMNAFARGTADCRAGISAFLNRQASPWKAQTTDKGTERIDG